MLQESDMTENKDMLIAAELIKNEGFTLAAVKEGNIISDERRGVLPLLTLIDKGISLKGYSVADKVIGKAVAFLYVLLEAENVYALTVSDAALEVFCRYGIAINYECKAEMIKNRDNTGRCPMESAVLSTDSPEEALKLIRKRLEELRNKN